MNWILAARPKTLVAALAPILVATALAWRLTPGGLSAGKWGLVLAALFAAIAIQIGTNLVNDVADAKRGADGAERLGPTRVTASGLLSPRAVSLGALACFLAALVFALPLMVAAGWQVLLLGLVCIAAGIAYTAGPFPLAYHGLGEVFVFVFFGLVPVGVLSSILLGNPILLGWQAPAVVSGAQMGLLSSLLILVNNIRDIHTDSKAGKRTLATRLGLKRTRMLFGAVIAAIFGLGLSYAHLGLPAASIIPLFTLPLATGLLRSVCTMEPSVEYNGLLARTAKLVVLWAFCLGLGLIVEI